MAINRTKKLNPDAMGPKPKAVKPKTGISAKVARGVPLIASASGVKGGRGANRAFGMLTGITAAKGGVKVDPLAVAMALPIAKLAAAAKALRAVGKIEQATALEARVGAKEAGRFFGGTGKKSQGLGLPMDRAIDVGGKARDYSTSLFPRLPNVGGDSPKLLRGSRDLRTFDTYADLTNEGAGRFARGTRRGNQLASAITRAEVQGGMYIGSKEAIKRAAFLSKRPRVNLPKGK